MIKRICKFVLCTAVLLCSGFTAYAAEETYPSVQYTDPFEWTEESPSEYPCTDEGSHYLAEKRIDNTANFYFYIEDSNSSIMSNQVYGSEILLWRPLESEGLPIQDKNHTGSPFAKTELLSVKINPYNLNKIAALDNGGIYYTQYGIPDGYFTANGTASVNTKGYINILTPEFELSRGYANAFIPSENEEAAHEWILADESDLTFCAVYGTKDWYEANIGEFVEWCASYQEETGKLSSNVPTYAEKMAAQNEAVAVKVNENDVSVTEQPVVDNKEDLAPQVIDVQESETTEEISSSEISVESVVILSIIVVSLITLLIIKIRERKR